MAFELKQGRDVAEIRRAAGRCGWEIVRNEREMPRPTTGVAAKTLRNRAFPRGMSVALQGVEQI